MPKRRRKRKRLRKYTFTEERKATVTKYLKPYVKYKLYSNKAIKLRRKLRKMKKEIIKRDPKLNLTVGLQKTFVEYLGIIQEAYKWLKEMPVEEKWKKYPHVIAELRRGIYLLASLHEKFNVPRRERYDHSREIINLTKEKDDVDDGEIKKIQE